MTGKIDQLGRIVIPKKMRDALGLTGGSAVNISLSDQEIHIEPASMPVKTEWIDGLMVVTGGEFNKDIASALLEARDSLGARTNL